MRLEDSFGRIHSDLRVSLTDRCSLRCSYCMPADGLAWLPRHETLSTLELLTLIEVAVGLGVETVRLTGGEPLLRPDVVDVVAAVAALGVELSMTTNGLRLPQLAPALREAGLRRVNISLDTLDRETFLAMTHRDRFEDTLTGIKAAVEAGLEPVKINTVLLRGVNDHEAPDLLRWAIGEGVQLRFIEQMPLDPQVGVVASVTRPFCGTCNRLRLTADGHWRNCLFTHDETDLRTPLRSGADTQQIAKLMVTGVRAKKAGHGINDPSFLQPPRPMSAIGG